MALAVDDLRSHFPSLTTGVAHFDGPGGTQTPDVVARAVAAALTSPLSNRGTVTASERAAEAIVVQARAAMADLIGADAGGVIFGRSMTALTFDLARALAAAWEPDDEIILTRLEHDANVRPWVQAAWRAGVRVRFADFDPATGELAAERVTAQLTGQTRLVAITGASNLIGTRPDVAAIARAVHAQGALVFVDGVHLTAHASVDMAALGADVYACSPYKFFGPHCGVLAAAPQLLQTLRPEKLLPSTDRVPERFELGTLPYELLAGTTAAVDFIAGLGAGTDRRRRLTAAMAAIADHEERLLARLEEGLADLPGVTNHARARARTPTVLLTFADRDPADGYRYLADQGINAPAGTFYAHVTARHLGLGDGGGLRIGLAAYTTEAEIDRLLDGLGRFTAAG